MKMLRSHYVLAVQDLDAAAEWFERVLGCHREDVDPGNWAYLSRDGVTFMCGRCPDAEPMEQLGDHQYFAYLVVDDLSAFHEHAERAGADIIKAPADEPWGMREMALRAFEGRRMMIAQRLDIA